LRGVKIPFLEREFNCVIGIVVVGAEIEEQSNPRELEIEVVGGLDEIQSIPVHVFSISDFQAMLTELNTIPDIVQYLGIRQKLFSSGQILQPVAEKDFISVFQTNYPVIEDLLKNPQNTALIERDTWKGIVRNNTQAFLRRERDFRFAKAIDYIIEEVHTTIGFNLSDEIEDKGPANIGPGNVEGYLFVAEELASIPRIVRAQLGEKIVDKCKAAAKVAKGFSYFVYLLEESGTPTVFLAHRGTREERYNRLLDLVSCADVFFKLGKAFGIAMTAFGQEESSYDFLYVEGTEYNEIEELEARAKQIFGPTQRVDYGEW